MKHLFSSAVVILFGVLSQGCIEEVAPTPVAEKNNLIVLGEIHYPKDYATVVLKEISSDQVYTEKVVSNASIALHIKSSDGTAEELPVVFEYDPLYKRYRTKERVPTQVGETYSTGSLLKSPDEQVYTNQKKKPSCHKSTSRALSE